MKKVTQSLILAASLACGFASGVQAQATTNWTIYYTGSITNWTAPSFGSYSIQAYGAQGGALESGSPPGGMGAVMGGTFLFNAGDILDVIVGGQGGVASPPNRASGYGGGGGGTFVAIS